MYKRQAQENSVARLSGGCPGSLSRFFASEDPEAKPARPSASAPVAEPVCEETPSQLSQWPVEIKLAPVQAPYFAGAHVLIAADCTAFAYADFHRGFMRGRITLIGCPKLDGVDYSQKLEALFASNDIASVTVARMEVPLSLIHISSFGLAWPCARHRTRRARRRSGRARGVGEASRSCNVRLESVCSDRGRN